MCQCGRDAAAAQRQEFLPPAAVPVWNAVGDAVLGHGGPVRVIASGDHAGKDTLVGELFAAPLLTDDGRADIILSAKFGLDLAGTPGALAGRHGGGGLRPNRRMPPA